MAESAGLELSEEVAALLAEDVCYRLREATQNSSQFLKHTRRRRLTVEDFNRALRWSNVEFLTVPFPPDPVPTRLRSLLAVHVSYLDGKGNLEPQGSVPGAVSALSDELLKYYQNVTRAVLGDDLHLMKVALQDLQTNSKIAALLPYFVYVVSGVS
ncbi:TAF6L factor, partial [Piaya cayana]|nr:TAF6L factor [Piaya cayana]